MPPSLLTALSNFTEPHSVEQLRALEEAVAGIDRTRLTEEAMRAIFDLYERFPEEDGYGLFSWFMHALESSGGYETNLLESVARKPGGFNVMMIGRFVNSAAIEIEGTNLLTLLESLATRTDISHRAREAAENCLANRRAQ